MNLEIRSCKSCNFISFSKAFEYLGFFSFSRVNKAPHICAPCQQHQWFLRTTHLCPEPAPPVIPTHHTSVPCASITNGPVYHILCPVPASSVGPVYHTAVPCASSSSSPAHHILCPAPASPVSPLTAHSVPRAR